jgi:hypothetical protein
MDLTSDIAGMLLLAAGVWLGILAKRRRFNRTNELGVERFPSFWKKLRQRSQDYMLMAGFLLMVAIGVILLSSNHMDGGGWVVMLPMSLLMLYLLLGT